MRLGNIRIGVSGWRYGGWRGAFYPKGLRQRDELKYAAEKFDSIEINGTFYSLQRPERFRQWHDETPADFVFALKGGRYITHMLRLGKVETALANYFASGVLRLDAKLGPVLWQLPPNTRFRPEVLERFFRLLPRTASEASALARRHDHRLKHAPATEIDADRPIRHALEVRHESFRDPTFIALLRRHEIALVVADTVAWPLLMDATANFVYLRLHGSKNLYASGYGPKALDRWAERIMAWAGGKEAEGEHAGGPAPRRATREVYVYFDNDAKVRAPADAQSLMGKLSALRRDRAA